MACQVTWEEFFVFVEKNYWGYFVVSFACSERAVKGEEILPYVRT
jgi:hypothetical protein